MAQCTAIKAEGGRCRNVAATGSDYCPAHDPARAQARKLSASKGGRSKGGGAEIKGLKAELGSLTAQVLAGEIETSKVAVANQLINTRLRAVEVERRIREQDELEERIAQLEASAGGQRGGKRWGA